MVTRASLMHDLLTSLFDAAGLARWIRYDVNLAPISSSLPGSAASLSDVADVAISLMERSGLIDLAFFERLLSAFPARSEEISRVASETGFGMLDATASSVANNRGMKQVTEWSAPESEVISRNDGELLQERVDDQIFASGVIRIEQERVRDGAIGVVVGTDGSRDADVRQGEVTGRGTIGVKFE